MAARASMDADLARKIGHAYASFLGAKRLVLGQDMRTHSPELADAASQGAQASTGRAATKFDDDSGVEVVKRPAASDAPAESEASAAPSEA